MGAKITKTVYWTCDRRGCNTYGQGEKLPDDWRYLTMFEPHNKPGVKNPNEVLALLCPRCTALFKHELDIRKEGKKNGDIPEEKEKNVDVVHTGKS